MFAVLTVLIKNVRFLSFSMKKDFQPDQPLILEILLCKLIFHYFFFFFLNTETVKESILVLVNLKEAPSLHRK